MTDLFGLSMMGNYEQRKVSRYEKDGLIIDTAMVTDSDDPYETGIRHPSYNKGDWVIVETYATKKLAELGHNKWVRKMTAENPPKELKDVSTCFIAKMLKSIDNSKN